ncbi:NAD-dependent epimerase/dehydratase family protein [Xanthobacter tagetidis]|uniref:NAD-dependent epimerase/dehydratase family protein n=1 Tax=Xanthobacter tagetidis TaxID=60216 RepID=A0A3L7ANE5_9HYPH|nr:NAD-dependent epimerase/dehydratase family protein [Xanthobacter tagetidis]MBB6307569.1 UDP-glucuronate 4-epimerase [Xanthobacter tagetidis]RLP81141.1 NAD-dependent epimerase/dehydratase family protein [Xanthobacter tagetidis]
MRFLITGTAGFIGFHLARRLLDEGHFVVGYDGMTDYYDPALKRARHDILARSNGFRAVEARLEDMAALTAATEAAAPDVMVHLAAQAGVRYSIEHPRTYVDSNLVGSYNVLEAARVARPKHLLMASTSSVYGGNAKMPFAETDRADWPITLYAATKKAMEAMAHSYAHLWGLPTTSFRFFTVYGPWGRPDMALFKFVDAILSGRPIEIYGMGEMRRDFTYVDDIVEAVVRLAGMPPVAGQPVKAAGVEDSLSPVAPWRAVNIGGGEPVGLLDFVKAIEAAVGREAEKLMRPMQPGDVRDTFADPRLLEALTGFRPQTPLDIGVPAFVAWYRDHYRK